VTALARRRPPILAAALLALAALALVLDRATEGRAQEGPHEGRPPGRAAPRPPDIVLMIGDGMGGSQVTLGRLVKGAPLALDGVRTTGLVVNGSLTGPATDSAAAITAIACGVRTRNRTLGVDGEGRPVRSVAEDLRARGWRVGIVTTTRVTHATPAGFYAHAASREDETGIARQLVESGVEVAIGGGARVFGEDLLARFREGGGLVLTSADALLGAARRASDEGPGGGGSREGAPRRVLALLAPGHLPMTLDADDAARPLSQLTLAALRLLSRGGEDRPPFLLLVEGGRIDHACHAHDAPAAAREVIAFDDAVAAALEWRRARGGLVVATADHATGGLAVSEKVDVEGLRRVRASAGAMLEAAAGDAGRLRAVVAERAGIALSEEEARACVTRKHPYSNDGTLAHLVSRRLGVSFAYTPDEQEEMHSTEGHDATLVPVYAEGPGAERFAGTIDNTDIARAIREIGGAAAAPGPVERPVPAGAGSKEY
jgi:alkaline phosphatase